MFLISISYSTVEIKIDVSRYQQTNWAALLTKLNSVGIVIWMSLSVSRLLRSDICKLRNVHAIDSIMPLSSKYFWNYKFLFGVLYCDFISFLESDIELKKIIVADSKYTTKIFYMFNFDWTKIYHFKCIDVIER